MENLAGSEQWRQCGCVVEPVSRSGSSGWAKGQRYWGCCPRSPPQEARFEICSESSSPGSGYFQIVINRDNLPHPTQDVAWWAAKTKGSDFSEEDKVNPEVFNRVIWEGLKGDIPSPTTRSGAEIRRGETPQPESRQVNTNPESK
jgi:hypothetical protein